MPEQPTSQALDQDTSLSTVFLGGLPTMAGIVTMIAQPFAQESLHKTLDLPAWLPFVVAIAVSGLLASYKVMIVRGAGARECAVCIPLLMLVIFSAYTTGNNVVYYAKEGYTKTPSASPSSEDLTAWKQERDLLQQQLKNAQDVIDSLRQALGMPASSQGAPRSKLPSVLGRLMPSLVVPAYAQEPQPGGNDPRSSQIKLDQLRKKLRDYEAQQQKLNEKLEAVKRTEAPRTSEPQQRLIKSW
jgi:hypothetical protein